jgi:tRNA G46 methylase TrmB
VNAGWRVDHNFLLFPNPWPKKQHFKRRFHGHPIFPVLLSVSSSLEIRSNWRLYLEEFALAVHLITNLSVNPRIYTPERFLTPFEEKYHKSGQFLYRLEISSLEHHRPISLK